MYDTFFWDGLRLTDDYGEIGKRVLEIVARINPHFGLTIDCYWDLMECEMLQLVTEFDDYNRNVKSEMEKGKSA